MKNIFCFRKALFLMASFYISSGAMCMEEANPGGAVALQPFSGNSTIAVEGAADLSTPNFFKIVTSVLEERLGTLAMPYSPHTVGAFLNVKEIPNNPTAHEKFEKGIIAYKQWEKDCASQIYSDNSKEAVKSYFLKVIEPIEMAAKENSVAAANFMLNFYAEEVFFMENSKKKEGKGTQDYLGECKTHVFDYAHKAAELGTPHILFLLGGGCHKKGENHYQKVSKILSPVPERDKNAVINLYKEADEFYKRCVDKYKIQKEKNPESTEMIDKLLGNIENAQSIIQQSIRTLNLTNCKLEKRGGRGVD